MKTLLLKINRYSPKPILIIIIPLLLYYSVQAQEPSIIWQQCYGGSYFDGAIGRGSLVLIDDAYVFIAETLSNDGQVTGNHGETDIWFVKTGFDGNIIWERCLGGTSGDVPVKLIKTNDGGFFVLGASASNDGNVSGNHGWIDYWAVKTDSLGNIQWQNCLGGSGIDEPRDVIALEDGGFMIVGDARSNDGDISSPYGFSDCWVVKLSETGELIWEKSFGGSLIDYGSTLKPLDDNGFILGGTVMSTDGTISCQPFGMTDSWLIKLDSNMDIVWQKCYGGTFEDGISNIVVLEDGFLLSGYTNSNDGDVSGFHGTPDDQLDIWVVRVDGLGNIIWQKCLGGSGADRGNFLAQTDDGGFLIVGASDSQYGDLQGCNHQTGWPPTFDAWVVKISGSGDIIWKKCLGGEVYQRADDAVFTSPNHIVILGVTGPDYTGGDVDCDLHGAKDIWLVELFDTLTNKYEYLSGDKALSVYPNPARDYVVFGFSANYAMSQNQTLNLEKMTISDFYCREIRNVVLYYMEDKIVWDCRDVKNGIYFYKMELHGKIVSGKIVINN